ncbi:flagellar protein FlaG [Halalkalibacter oceani]|uniref:Flagellar protein FlaG n=1 Tax=Halalkalibacter oceani TaxID=1653776 RepID=A0A9X2INW6_9BACI|nr:flagellar protein FlaG [Halalkalibacter oceani]MCM3714650.1 flagellar protein FlaG [Halalkalibacter oceani]
MDVKSASSQGLSNVFQSSKSDSASKESPSTIIEKGIAFAKEQFKEEVTKDRLQKQADSMNQLLETNMTALKFNIHEDLNRTYVQVVNRETDEIVKEIPPEKFLDMVASMLKQAGLIVDERV